MKRLDDEPRPAGREGKSYGDCQVYVAVVLHSYMPTHTNIRKRTLCALDLLVNRFSCPKKTGRLSAVARGYDESLRTHVTGCWKHLEKDSRWLIQKNVNNK